MADLSNSGVGYLGEVVNLSDSILGCSGGVADLWIPVQVTVVLWVTFKIHVDHSAVMADLFIFPVWIILV